MKTLDTIEVTLPVYWASYLINGDASGLQDGEQEEIDAYMELQAPYTCAVDCEQESTFSWRNDANNLGGDVLRFTLANNGTVKA